MKKTHLLKSRLIALCTLAISGFSYAANDDPLLFKVMLDEVETGVGSNKPTSFEAEAWLGKDINKLWLKAEGEYQNSDDKEAQAQALYSRAISAYWDVQAGIRADRKPSVSREWAVVGIKGLAPYYFDIDAALFVGNDERTALRLRVEHDMLITQKLILTPVMEINAYGKNDPGYGVGAGLADVNGAIRLRYEIVREFAPYIGVDWQQKYGNTAKYARARGDKKSHTQLVVGFRAWF